MSFTVQKSKSNSIILKRFHTTLVLGVYLYHIFVFSNYFKEKFLIFFKFHFNKIIKLLGNLEKELKIEVIYDETFPLNLFLAGFSPLFWIF
jgi:hypothetical protein